MQLLRFALLVAIGLGGCANPAAFRPAKTVGAGRVEHAMGLQFGSPMLADKDDAPLAGTLPGSGGVAPPFTPTYAIRVGITDWLQLGGQLGYPFLRAEAQVQFLETTFLDLAIGADVGSGAAPFGDLENSEDELSFALPLIAGLNLLPNLSIVAHVAPASWGDVGMQYGAGIDLALPILSIRPHISFFDPFEAPSSAAIRQAPMTVLGLDLAFGGS